MLLTIFTPTYNRAYCLTRLYESLVKQTVQKFEWIIVDDGSSDETLELVKQWIDEQKIVITYEYQENAGKPSAYNRGVELASAELFTCVDSDDYLMDDAVEIILQQWDECSDAIGILNFKIDESGSAITDIRDSVKYSTLGDAYRKHGLTGDTLLTFRTALLKKYPFPKFEDEKFVPEAYLYDQLDKEGKLYFGCREIYVGEYLEDGLTASIHKINAMNPHGYKAFIKQRVEYEIEDRKDVKTIMLDIVRLISINMVLRQKTSIEMRRLWKFVSFLLFPLGLYRYRRDYLKYLRR